jgi:predicted O-linked N-acetylglucosamine transferase (SPINDLY family)
MAKNTHEIKQRYETALGFIKTGQYTQAEELLGHMVSSDKSSVPFRLALGECARKQNRFSQAAQWYRSVLDFDPVNFAAHCNYGSIMMIEKNYTESEKHFRQAIKINPGQKALFTSLGMALLEQKQYENAAEMFNNARVGSTCDIQNDTGLLRSLIMSKRLTETQNLIQQLTSQFPQMSQLYNAIGNAFREADDNEQAKIFYVKALQIQPDNAEGHYNLGCVMRQWNKLDEAVICFKNATRLDPLNKTALVDLGETLQLMGECDEAETQFKAALSLDPDCTMARDNLLVSMLYNPRYSVKEVYDTHNEWGCKKVHTNHLITNKNASSGSKSLVRVGYLSPDFCKHPTATLLEPVITLHDRNTFEVFCYSQTRFIDQKTEMFKKSTDQWREISHLSDNDTYELIKGDQIDILVDCAGHMAGNRLGVFAMHPSKIQISGFGYPSTTGLQSINYRITDSICEPAELHHLCNEKLLYIDHGFFTYVPPSDAPGITELPSIEKNYITFGSLHTTARLNNEVIQLWSEILKTVNNSRLILFRTTLTESIIKRITGWFENYGIASNRITFLNQIHSDHYLTTYHDIDISLDTFPWSGHTTACESLWMGVPMITLKGDRHASRMVASLMERIGLPEFVADSSEKCIDIAKIATSDLHHLNTLRGSMRQRMLHSPVSENEKWVRELEDKYLRIVNQ